MTDARTTPPRLRVPVLAGIGALVLYFLACFHWALDDDAPGWAGFGGWQMFTERSTTHALVEAEAKIDGEWRPIDLQALFPSMWDSGPRYTRSSFRRSQSRMRVLADSTCGRMPEAPEEVRFWEVRFPQTYGVYPQPRRKEKRTELLSWTCGKPVKRPEAPRW